MGGSSGIRKPAKTYRDLIVWQKAIAAGGLIYQVTRSFPRVELYGLTAQLRRCAISIPSNIAEGFGRRGQGEFHHFLHISRGSIFELETQMLMALNAGLVPEEDYGAITVAYDEVERMLESLIRRVDARR
jgi:four helix bundle protein